MPNPWQVDPAVMATARLTIEHMPIWQTIVVEDKGPEQLMADLDDAKFRGDFRKSLEDVFSSPFYVQDHEAREVDLVLIESQSLGFGDSICNSNPYFQCLLDPDRSIFSTERLGLKSLTSKMVLSMARQVKVPTASRQNAFAFAKDTYKEKVEGEPFFRVANFCFVHSDSLYFDGLLWGSNNTLFTGDLGSRYVYEKPRK